MNRLTFGVVVALGVASGVAAQDVFHSPQAANLPTTATLPQGDLLFEISHRFLPPVSNGAEDLWGFDGPVNNRLGLAYAATDRLMLGALRSNRDDNLELNAKMRLFDGGSAVLPLSLGVMGGVAWNTADVFGVDDNEAQLYAQVILNVLMGERFGLGVVPTYLRNPRILDLESENGFVLGLNGQVYLSESMSILGEWIVSEARVGLEHHSGTFGVEIETRGHFFKLVLTNQVRMNPTQFLGGTPSAFSADELRVGFNITRRLAL
jgi:hypothetical protein